MEFSDFEATLAKDKLAPIYHLSGEESFLVRRALRKIDDALERTRGSFAGRETYEAEKSWGEAMASIYTDSMFGDSKTVVVSDFERLLDSEDSSSRKSQKVLEQIQKIVDNAPAGSILILVTAKLDKRTKIAKLLAAKTAQVNCDPLKPYQMEKWILKRVKDYKLRMSKDASQTLVRRLGGALENLEHELQKLSLFQPAGPEISDEEIRLLIEDQSEEPIYQLYNALDQGDRRRAYETLKDILEHVDHPLQIVAGLSRHVSELLSYVSMREHGVKSGEIQKKLGASSFKMNLLAEGAGNFDSDRLTRMLRLLECTDEKMKSGSLSGSDLLYHLVGLD